MNKTINEELDILYNKNWTEYFTALEKIWTDDSQIIKPSNPLLLHFDEEKEKAIAKADFKVMIYGQETNNWGEFKNDRTYIKDDYLNFFCTGNCFKYGGQFWNGFKRFKELLERKYPEKKIEFIWNNVLKTGRNADKNKPSEIILNLEETYFNVMQGEIEIIKPDIILFLSGPYYDNELCKRLGDISFNTVGDFSSRQLAKVSFRKNTYRTYHPNYLWRTGINNYFNAIINDLII